MGLLERRECLAPLLVRRQQHAEIRERVRDLAIRIVGAIRLDRRAVIRLGRRAQGGGPGGIIDRDQIGFHRIVRAGVHPFRGHQRAGAGQRFENGARALGAADRIVDLHEAVAREDPPAQTQRVGL